MQGTHIAAPFFSSLERRLAAGLGLAWLVAIFVLLVVFPPYWALMDDHNFLRMQSEQEDQSFADWWSGVLRQSFLAQRSQMIYQIYAALFYGLFHRWPSLVAYLVLYGINVGIFWMWGSALARCLVRDLPESGRIERATWRWLYLILCFHFISFNNLFFFASLQERLVILFMGIALHGLLQVTEASLKNKVDGLGGLMILLGTLCAAQSKEPAIALVLPVFVWVILLGFSHNRYRGLYLGLAILMMIVGVGGALFFFSIREGYSADYQFLHMAAHLGNPWSKFYQVSAVALITALLAWLGWWRRGDRNALALYRLLFWPLGMISYALVMLPWHRLLEYYLAMPVGAFWIGAKLIIFREVVDSLRRWKKWPYVLLFIAIGLPLAAITPVRKFYQKAAHHHGTGLVVQFLDRMLREATELPEIRMPEGCPEASGALGNFLNRPGLVQMAPPRDPFYKKSEPARTKILVTHRECARVPDTFHPREEIFRYHQWVIYEQRA